MIAASFSRLF